MKITNRKDLRTAVKASIDAALVGPTKVAQICYKYQTGEFDETLNTGEVANVSVLVLTSSGSDRQEDNTLYPAAEQLIFLNLHSFVLYEKENEWTESQSEDAIDDLEAAIVEWWSENSDRRDESTMPAWLQMSLMGRSEVSSAFIGGIEYRHEIFGFAFLVANTE